MRDNYLFPIASWLVWTWNRNQAEKDVLLHARDKRCELFTAAIFDETFNQHIKRFLEAMLWTWLMKGDDD